MPAQHQKLDWKVGSRYLTRNGTKVELIEVNEHWIRGWTIHEDKPDLKYVWDLQGFNAQPGFDLVEEVDWRAR